jgi:hypothetical protein
MLVVKRRCGQAAGMKKVYKVALSGEEEAELQALISKGRTSARTVTRARILLLAHAGEKDAAVARALQTSVSTVERTRKNLVLEGVKAALEEAPRPGAKPKLDAKGHGFLVALACSTPPQGREGWTLELLSDRLVALGCVESFSKEAVRRALKKTNSSPGCINNGPSRRRARSSSGAWRT